MDKDELDTQPAKQQAPSQASHPTVVKKASPAPKAEATKSAPEPKEDRSAFNCTECKGEGLNKSQTDRCPTCGGTGKV